MIEKENRVLKFMESMNQGVYENPENTPLETRQVAIKLIFEELEELAVALDVQKTFSELCEMGVPQNKTEDGNEVNPLEALDAFCDIDYTNLWGVCATGLSDRYSMAFNEVCRSNDSKTCPDLETAQRTKELYENKGVECFIETNKFGEFIVKNINGKALKSIDYSKAELEKFLK